MPFIGTKVNIEISKDKENIIKTKLGQAIELLPGKTEQWLMLSIEDNCNMYFKGSNEPHIAFIEVKLFGSQSKEAYNKLTKAITDIFYEELNITPSNLYVKYEEIDNWGWNGNNF
jgi:phenylpyruvate tautomerase PptA (4-oxalocrotonate tautomerase family)